MALPVGTDSHLHLSAARTPLAHVFFMIVVSLFSEFSLYRAPSGIAAQLALAELALLAANDGRAGAAITRRPGALRLDLAAAKFAGIASETIVYLARPIVGKPSN